MDLVPPHRGNLGRVAVGSFATGIICAALLVAAPFIPPTEDGVTGAMLCGFALGWALLAGLSGRHTDQPQRWALAPALFMGLGGLLLLAWGPAVRGVLDRVWPPALLALSVWMLVRLHHQPRGRVRGLLLRPLVVLLALVSLAGGYETVSEAVDARVYPPPGQLIDVGGHRLHLSCTGSGGPTVVLEPGAGGTSSDMGWIAPAVAGQTRVCVYDRAGRGWSEPAGTRQDAAQIATDLHTLLEHGNIPGPYVLAGHSFGGLYVLTFAARFPDDVAGMVLVDSTAPAPPGGPGAAVDAGPRGLIDRVSALVSVSARFGLGRLYGKFAYDSLPARSRGEAGAHAATAGQLRSTIDEYVRANSSVEQAASLTSFDDKPLAVLTAGEGNDATHAAAQDRLASLSTNSVHCVIDGASHAALVEEEGPATATTQAILDVVGSVRSSGRLVP